MSLSDRHGFAAGAAVAMPCPCSDRLAEKRRPAGVVSGEAVARAGFVWNATIAGARNPALSGGLPIEDLEEAGPAVASVVRPSKIARAGPSRILGSVGSLRPELAQRVHDHVRVLIGPP